MTQNTAFTNTTKTISYTYDAAGQRLRKTYCNGTANTISDYANGFVYVNGALEYLSIPEGRMVLNRGEYEDQFNLIDHLGNVRSVFHEGSSGTAELLEERHYYPLRQAQRIAFGLEMPGMGYVKQGPENKYRFNGKELQDENNLYMLDFGARMYDPQVGRWWSVDKKAEKFNSVSPYIFGINNPIRFIDPDGNEIVDATGTPITYDPKNGWSDNATNDVKVIHSALMQTETGVAQWEKAYGSDSKIEINIVDQKLYTEDGGPSLGQANQALGYDLNSSQIVKTDNTMKIEISLGSIKESLNGKNNGLSLREAIAATAGHEIEHTTNENRSIGIQQETFKFAKENFNEKIEKKPEAIGNKIREEHKSFVELKKIEPKIERQDERL